MELVLNGDDENSFAEIEMLVIQSTSKKIAFIIEPITNHVLVVKNLEAQAENKKSNDIKRLDAEIKNLEQSIGDSNLKKSSKEYIQLID